MAGYREWLAGLKGRRTKRQGRVAGGVAAPVRPEPAARKLAHPLTHLAMGAGLTVVVIAVVAWGREPTARRLVGTALLVAMLNSLFFVYLATFRREVLKSRAKASLVALLSVAVLVAARLSTMVVWPPHLVPVTLATIVLAVVFDRRLALETSWMLLLYVTAILMTGEFGGVDYALRSLIVLSAGMLVAVLATGRIRTRSKIIQVGFLIGVIQFLAVAGIRLCGVGAAPAESILSELAWSLAHGVLVGFVVSGSLPFIEYVFRVSTDISLLELSDISQQPVLRRMLVRAPGTYNHSFIVGMLAEHAAEAIGANPLLARVGAYYHDIGKMMKPEYYGENEVIPGLHHRPLSPTMSTLIIRAHVKDGVELAKHHDLPGPILDIIEQHHGTTLVEYFYNEALKRAREDERVEEPAFRYPGPKPQTKEAGIVMLADSVEAATRSLSEPTPARIESTIQRISRKKLDDAQLDECGLTLSEVRQIEGAFVRVLAGIFHRRPRYPEIVGSGGKAARGGTSPEESREPERVNYFTST